jgi:adenosine deaminase
MSQITTFIAGLPKAELHLHLEGAVSPALFARLRDKYGVPALEAAGQAGHFPDLAAFLAVYGQVCSCMRDGDDYRSMVDGIVAGMHAARADFGLIARLIPAHNRELGLERGMAFLETVLSYRPPEVIGIGLDYAERPHPPAQFAPLFAAARSEGLKVTAHAGEDGPASYVRDAIDLLGCRRIDHGYHVDPGLFATTLNREYTLVAEAFGLSEATLADIAANGLEYCWSPAVLLDPTHPTALTELRR